jgi:7tm Odorant receptor
VAVDSFFFCCCLNICAFFDVLRKSFDVYDKKKFIQEHQIVLRLSKDLKALIKPVVFTQFLLSAMQLCVIGFQCVMLDGLVRRFVPALFGKLCEMKFSCYCCCLLPPT